MKNYKDEEDDGCEVLQDITSVFVWTNYESLSNELCSIRLQLFSCCHVRAFKHLAPPPSMICISVPAFVFLLPSSFVCIIFRPLCNL
jgi:hypothetical protein